MAQANTEFVIYLASVPIFLGALILIFLRPLLAQLADWLGRGRRMAYDLVCTDFNLDASSFRAFRSLGVTTFIPKALPARS